MDHSLSFWLAAALASLFVGMSKGGLPMVALLAVPILSFYMPPAAAAGLVLPVYIISDMYGMWLYRREFSKRILKIMLPAGFVGIVLGFLTVSVVSSNVVKAVVGIVGLYYLTDKYLRAMRSDTAARPADVPRGLFWGTLAGYTSYLTHAGGPPFQTYVLPQKPSKMVFAGTATIFFSIVNLLKLPPYILAGQITWEGFTTILWLTPVAVFGAWAGYRLVRIIPEGIFFKFVELALLLLSLKLLYDAFSG